MAIFENHPTVRTNRPLTPAVLAVGVGQAEAATWDVDVTWISGAWICAYDCDGVTPPDPNDYHVGIDIGETKSGTLSIDPYVGWGNDVTLTLRVADSVIVSSPMTTLPGRYQNFWAYHNLWVDWDGASGLYHYEDDRTPYFWKSEFRISLTQPAPVPVPASVALLSVSMGALAMMRKRRKAV